jgi:hypothetical protein
MRLICTKVLRKAFLYLHSGFELLLAQEYERIFANILAPKEAQTLNVTTIKCCAKLLFQ